MSLTINVKSESEEESEPKEWELEIEKAVKKRNARRLKQLIKFKDRKGKFQGLPTWIDVFENDTVNQFETMRENIVDQALEMRRDIGESMDSRMTKMTETVARDIGETQKMVQEKVKKVGEQINDRIQDMETKQTDEKGLLTELIVNIRKANENLANDLNLMGQQMLEKTEKVGWFERKLNKWIKLFETAETDGATRHNSLIKKINEAEKYSNNTFANLEKQI